MIEDSATLAQRTELLAAIRKKSVGLGLGDFHSLTSQLGFDTIRVLNELYNEGQVRGVHGAHGRGSEYVMRDDPWYQEPRQRFMRKIVLRLLYGTMAGLSRRKLLKILHHREQDCDDVYVRRLMGRMLHEGVVLLVSGTEKVMVPLVDTDGRLHEPQGAATLSSTPGEKQTTLFRLSTSRWLKDAANDDDA